MLLANRASVTTFLLWTSPRSGSAWLVDLLDSHPEVVAYGGLFHAETTGFPTYGACHVPYVVSVGVRAGRRRDVPRRVAHVRRALAAPPGIRAVGFKLGYGQVSQNPGAFPHLILRRLKVVQLVRDNLLKALVSYRVAKARGVFHAVKGERLADVRVWIDAESLVDALAEQELVVERARASVARFRLSRIEVSYERLLEDRDVQLARVFRFLGADPARGRAESSLARMSKDSLRDVIENVDEVQSALAGTRFEWMFD